jgi:hypothetical protein
LERAGIHQPRSSFRAARRRDRLQPLLRRSPRSAQEQECQRRTDPGEHDAGQKRGLEALGQRDERVGILVRRQVVLGAGDGSSLLRRSRRSRALLDVLTLRGAEITAITSFVDGAVFARFGLPGMLAA